MKKFNGGNENMELVMIFAGMATICFGLAISGVIAEKRGYNTGAIAGDATATAIGFGMLALVGLLFV
jgi:hypothetical protein